MNSNSDSAVSSGVSENVVSRHHNNYSQITHPNGQDINIKGTVHEMYETQVGFIEVPPQVSKKEF